jgi:hypothetical protein
MQNTFEKIIIGIFAAVLIFFGAVLFSQQRAINQVKSQISKGAISSVPVSKPTSNNIVDADSQRYLGGEIKAVAGDVLEVETTLSKLKDPNKFKTDKPINMGPDDFDIIVKTVQISINDKTKFVSLKKEDLKVGDKILASTDNSPFNTENLTALSIAYPVQAGLLVAE